MLYSIVDYSLFLVILLIYDITLWIVLLTIQIVRRNVMQKFMWDLSQKIVSYSTGNKAKMMVRCVPDWFLFLERNDFR